LGVAPPLHQFPLTTVGGAGAPAAFIVSNHGSIPLGRITLTLGGPDALDFAIESNGCSGNELQAGGSCSFTVLFRPRSAGSKAAVVTIIAAAGGTATVNLAGEASP
jgi:hypothetical protein